MNESDTLYDAMKIFILKITLAQVWLIVSSMSANALITPPPNDNLDQAAVLAGNEWSTVGTTVGATLQIDDGEVVDVSNVNYSTVWYRWLAPSTGVARIDFRNSISGVRANIYIGPVNANFSQLIRIAEFEAISDSYGQAAFPVLANQVYYIQVGEYDNYDDGYLYYDPEGPFTMSLLTFADNEIGILRPDVAHFKINDKFDNSILLSGHETSQIVYSWNATAEPQEPYTDIEDPTLWWSWIAPKSGTLTVKWKYYYSGDSRGIVYEEEEGIQEIFTGTKVDLLSVQSTNNDGSIYVREGQKYYFRGPVRIWDSWFGGAITREHLAVMKLSLYVPPPPPAPIQFQFGSGTYSVYQTSGSIRIPISYTGTAQNSQVWVEYNTEGLTGSSGVHYQGTSSSVVYFPSGKKATSITVPIYYSGSTTNRTFRVNLVSMSEGVKVSPSSTVVTIKGQSGSPVVVFDTLTGRVGNRAIRGRILNVPSQDIRRITLRNMTNTYKVSGKNKWESPVLNFATKGTYKFTAIVTLRNKSKISKTIYYKVI